MPAGCSRKSTHSVAAFFRPNDIDMQKTKVFYRANDRTEQTQRLIGASVFDRQIGNRISKALECSLERSRYWRTIVGAVAGRIIRIRERVIPFGIGRNVACQRGDAVYERKRHAVDRELA